MQNQDHATCMRDVSLGRKYMWQMKTKLIKIHYLWNAMSGCSIAVRSNSNYLSHSVSFEKLHSASSKKSMRFNKQFTLLPIIGS